MKNLFKFKSSKEEDKAKEKKGIFKNRTSKDDSQDSEIKVKRSGEYNYENVEALGYC